MYDKDLKKRITERVAKKEEEKDEDMHAESDQVQPEEPKVPPPEMVSMEIQTDESFLTEPKPGSSSKEEVPAPPGSSQKGEEPMEKNDDIQKDDTAPATRFFHGQDTTGNEDDSIFRELSKCFTNNYHEEWSGFYNQGYLASSQHRHMFWHVKYRETNEPTQRAFVHRLRQAIGNLYCQTYR